MLEKHENSMSAKQIRAVLGLKKSATPKLKAELQKLIKAKKIKKQGTHYFIIENLKVKIKENVQNESIMEISSKTYIK